jgi:peptidoglycan/LPS O-acetylase OafA/YrhL
MTRSLSAFLDCLRWVSALAVLAGHIRAFVFLPYPQLQSPGVLLKVFYWTTGFGHQAVLVFFVLSGFLVGGGVVDKIRSDRFHWTDYLSNRLSRLYPVLIAALLLGWGLDYFGCRYLNSAGLYTVPGPEVVIGVIDYNASQRTNPTTLLTNLSMLQGIHGTTFGTNSPLWSLSMEFWYYLLFPVAAIFVGTRTWRGLFRWNTVLFVGLIVGLPMKFYAYFLIWLMGVAAAAIPVPLRRALPWGALLFAALASSRIGIGNVYACELLIGFSCAMLISTVKNAGGFPTTLESVHRRLSGFSYTIYLFHFPVLIFCLSVLSQASLWKVGGGVIGRFPLFGVLLALCLSASYLLSKGTEEKTPLIRKMLNSWFIARSAP